MLHDFFLGFPFSFLKRFQTLHGSRFSLLFWEHVGTFRVWLVDRRLHAFPFPFPFPPFGLLLFSRMSARFAFRWIWGCLHACGAGRLHGFCKSGSMRVMFA